MEGNGKISVIQINGHAFGVVTKVYDIRKRRNIIYWIADDIDVVIIIHCSYCLLFITGQSLIVIVL